MAECIGLHSFSDLVMIGALCLEYFAVHTLLLINLEDHFPPLWLKSADAH